MPIQHGHQRHALDDAMVNNQWLLLWDAVGVCLALAAVQINVCG